MLIVATQSSKLYRHQKPLREIVGDAIREQIFDGILLPGTRLVERDVADAFNVSRLPVREALRVLKNEGLVDNLPSRGVVVRTFDKRQVSELFDIREALEILAVHQGTKRHAAGAESGLEEAIKLARKAIESGDLDAAHRANSVFHDKIITLADNQLLEKMLDPLLGRLHWLFRQVTNVDQVIAEHARILEAIASGDPERATAVTRAHVLSYRAQTMQYLFDNEL